MKTIQTIILLGIIASTSAWAADEVSTNTPAHTDIAPATNAPVLLASGEPGLRMNFRGASLDLVLNYLSEAAGDRKSVV